MFHIRLFIGIVSIAFFVATFELIRKRHLLEEYAILWLFTSSIIAVLSLWPGLIGVLSRLTGLYYITAVLAIIFSFIFAILMHYSLAISKMKETNKALIQRCAYLELRIKELESGKKNREAMERATGLEPATSSLGSLHSTS
jgi:hypothetical protein